MCEVYILLLFFFSSRRRHTISYGDWSSDVCSSDLARPSLSSAFGLLRGRPLQVVTIAGSLLGLARSEERRVGKECRCRWSPYHLKKNKPDIKASRVFLRLAHENHEFILIHPSCWTVFIPIHCSLDVLIFFFKQKTAYEIVR